MSFSKKDKVVVVNMCNNAIIIITLISNYQIISILLRSSINIIFKSIFDKMGLANFKLVSTRGLLYNLLGDCKETKGMITLLLSWRKDKEQFTTIADLL